MELRELEHGRQYELAGGEVGRYLGVLGPAITSGTEALEARIRELGQEWPVFDVDDVGLRAVPVTDVVGPVEA